MENNIDKIIDEIAKTVKQNGLSAEASAKTDNVLAWKKNRKTSGFVTLLSQLANMPKTPVEKADFSRVKNQILDRIALPQTVRAGWFASIPYAFRLGVGIVGSFLIIISLTVGVAVAALDSVPGSTIYPLKKVVENIQLKLASNDEKALLQVKFADNRVEELQQVLEKQQQGELSEKQTQQIVAATVKDLKKSTAAAAAATASQPKTSIVTKLADINDKLKAASVASEGQVKIELEDALEATQTSQEEATKNVEQAGLKIEGEPIVIADSVKASGKLTSVTETTVSIGTAKFLLTKDTKFVNMTVKDLKAGILASIEGKTKDNKTYAVSITLVAETEPVPTTSPTNIQTQETPITDTNTAPQ